MKKHELSENCFCLPTYYFDATDAARDATWRKMNQIYSTVNSFEVKFSGIRKFAQNHALSWHVKKMAQQTDNYYKTLSSTIQAIGDHFAGAG